MKRTKLFVAALVLSLSSVLGVIAPQVHAAGTFTWDGGGADNNMTTAANWAGDTAPSGDAGEDLVFPANVTKVAVTNDFTAATEFNSITFSGAATQASGYTLSGNSITLVGGITNSMTGSASKSQSLGMPLILNGDQTFDDGGSSLSISGAIDLGSSALTLDVSYYMSLSGVISGTGTITKTGTEDLVMSGANTYSGATTVSAGKIVTNSATGLGTAAGGTTVASGAGLYFYKDTGDVTITEPLTLAGTGPSAYSPTLLVGTNYNSGSGGDTLTYPTTTFSGTITLQSNIKVGASSRNAKFTGAITGNYTITITDSSTGSFEIASSSNHSATSNGVLAPSAKETKYEDDSSSTTITVNPNETAIVTGKYGSVTVYSKGVLKGTGTVGAVMVSGTIAPGLSPGCLTTGDLSLYGSYAFELGGTTACSGYDQIIVAGTVQAGGTLNVSRYNKFVPKAGQKYVIISNDGSDAVSGTFDDLAEGATFTADGVTFSISYKGGDGNDVELTVTAVSPDTGFAVLANNPYATMAAMLGAAGGIALLARRQLRPAFAVRRKR